MKRMNKRQITLNLAQIVAIQAPAKIKYLEWGRGTGKSTVLAYFIVMMVKYMPKATFILVGNTYAQVLSNTLKSTKKALEFFGIYEDVDYVVGSSQGKRLGYSMPYEKPNHWNNIIHFSNGTVFQLVGLDNPNSSNGGRGINSSGILADEAALLDQEKLAINVKNTNRSFAKSTIHGENPFLFSETYVSSTPLTKKGKWFTDAEELAMREPDKIFFHKATAHWNLDNLRPDYFEYMKQSYSSDVIYNAEMLNIRPKEITDGFYPQLTEDHYYTNFDNDYLEGLVLNDVLKERESSSFNCKQDSDLIKSQPLIISVDWGANINAMTIHQQQDDIWRVLKEFFVKSPKILDHLFLEEFLPYYAPHQCKEVYFYYDRTGNNRVANSKMTFADQAKEIMEKNGWTVYMMTTGLNPSYMDKFRLINVALKEDGRGKMPKVRINKANCPNLIVSMEHAEAYDRGRGLEKDKRPEQRKGVEQEHATHLSDTFDYPFFSRWWDKFNGSGVGADDMPISSISLVS
ncbi:terminase family protein [Flavobacteriaceae bacterium TK19130]|nr:terminase family protein [Thermobacterium salinum]